MQHSIRNKYVQTVKGVTFTVIIDAPAAAKVDSILEKFHEVMKGVEIDPDQLGLDFGPDDNGSGSDDNE